MVFETKTINRLLDIINRLLDRINRLLDVINRLLDMKKQEIVQEKKIKTVTFTRT